MIAAQLRVDDAAAALLAELRPSRPKSDVPEGDAGDEAADRVRRRRRATSPSFRRAAQDPQVRQVLQGEHVPRRVEAVEAGDRVGGERAVRP